MPNRINHWIDGAPVAGTSGRTGPVFNPATGLQSGEVDLASADEVAAAVASAKAAAARVALGLAVAPVGACCSRSASCCTPTPTSSPRSSPPSTARCSPTPHGEIARAPGERRVRLRRARSCSRAASASRPRTGVDVYSIRQPLGVVAGITPFNFPAMVPLWMAANAIACGNAFVLKPSEKDPSAVAVPGRAVEAGRPARRRVHRRARRQGGRRRAARRTPTSRRSASSARRRSRATSTRPAPRTASGCRPSAGRRTTCSCCPTPTSTWPPTPPSRPPTARPASAAWRSRSRSRSATSATGWSTRSPPGCPSCASATAPTPTPTWAR